MQGTDGLLDCFAYCEVSRQDGHEIENKFSRIFFVENQWLSFQKLPLLIPKNVNILLEIKYGEN